MKNKISPILSMGAVLFSFMLTTLFPSCNDDLAADSYYTFTGEMMSDFLDNHEDFSQFKRIVERAGRMDLLASRGARTLFPPVNSGVEDFLKERGYASVEDIPASFCDTLVKACLVERTLYTYNLSETHQESNQLDLPVIIVTDGDTVDANGMTLSVINRRAAIINELKNDSVENGVVHPVDKVIVPNTSLGASLLDDNHQGYNAGDNSEEGTEAGGHNWYLPPGYLKDVKFSENTIFFLERPIVQWSNMGGDVVGILGTSYDITFRLPNVPPGTYELRLGYTALESRGIGQVYIDGIPQGLPLDMRVFGNDGSIGGLYNGWSGWRNKDENTSGIYTTEELEENARIMKNNGYYSAPKGLFWGNDGTDAPRYSPNTCTSYYNCVNLLRSKICNVEVKPNTHHTVRLRSVLTSGETSDFTLDYLELVPIDICGAGGLGEDLY